MAEIVIRAGATDVAMLNGVFGACNPAGREWSPHRLVVDAHAAPIGELAMTARRAGVPFLIDPQTFYLQDYQHSADAWAWLPFATTAQLSAADLAHPRLQDALVDHCLEYQIEHGATMLLAPYVNIEKAGDGWLQVQLGLLERTRRVLDGARVGLPVIAVLALGWRLLGRTTWPHVLEPLLTAAHDAGVAEIALAASKVDQGVRHDQRLGDLIAAVERARSTAPVLAWSQGLFGEACVAAGATGYETGVGWREQCDISTAKRNRRAAPSGGFGARPVYIAALGQSLPKASVRALVAHRVVLPNLICAEPECCPEGPMSLLGDTRAHTIASRRRAIATLDGAASDIWGRKLLADHSASAFRIARRINTIRVHDENVSRVNAAALLAIHALADSRRIARTAA